jgi:hypothetical protein
MKESFYEELKPIFDKFPKYHVKMLLGDFNAKTGKTLSNQQLRRRV